MDSGTNTSYWNDHTSETTILQARVSQTTRERPLAKTERNTRGALRRTRAPPPLSLSLHCVHFQACPSSRRAEPKTPTVQSQYDNDGRTCKTIPETTILLLNKHPLQMLELRPWGFQSKIGRAGQEMQPRPQNAEADRVRRGEARWR